MLEVVGMLPTDKWFRWLLEERDSRGSPEGIRSAMSALLDKGPQTGGSPYKEEDDEKPRLKGKKTRNQVPAPPGAPGATDGPGGPVGLEEEVETDSFKMRSELEPTLWKDKAINKEIQKRLEEIASDFIDSLEIELDIEEIRLTGSLANYNWSKYSDVDLHIVVDYEKISENTELVKAYFDAARARWNDMHAIEIEGYEVEVYIEDVDQKHQSSGVYSITKSEWVIEPEPHDVEIDIATARKKSDDIETRINLLQLAIKAEKANNVDSTVRSIKSKIARMRQTGLDSPQKEFSAENIAFKILRRNMSLDRLSKLARTAYDDKMSTIPEKKVINEV